MPDSPAAASALLREVARLYTRAQRGVAGGCQTTPTQCHLLTELGRAGPLASGELGARLQLEKSWVSRAVDSLVAAGLVTKEPHPSDARSALVTLTAAGRRRLKTLNRTLDDHAAQLLQALDARDRATVQRALVIVRQALRADTSAGCCPSPPERRKESSCR
jgi:DNA-binding MarR family transcriptional regulator